jgi:hypothetical protein
MGQSTTEVRQDIERTRDEMSGTINARSWAAPTS